MRCLRSQVRGLIRSGELRSTNVTAPENGAQQLKHEMGRLDATPRTTMRATGTDGPSASPSKNGSYGPSDAKRATGLEPATFSLEG